jgi:hypothetical protein
MAVCCSRSFNCGYSNLFPRRINGLVREKYPEKFGEVVDEADRKAQVELK